MTTYVALLHPKRGGGYCVKFPDFPACVTQGKTLNAAAALAQQTIERHAKALLDSGLPLPHPSSLASVRFRVGNREALAIAVKAPERPPRYVRVSLTIPEQDLRDIDAYARSQGSARCTFLVQAARQAMAK